MEAMNTGINVGCLIDTLPLYSEQCLMLLRQALELEDSGKIKNEATNHRRKAIVESSDSEDDVVMRQSSESSSEEEEEEDEEGSPQDFQSADSNVAAEENQPATGLLGTTSTTHHRQILKTKKPPKLTQSEQQLQYAVNKHVENLVCDTLPVNDNEVILVPTALRSKQLHADIAERNYIPQSRCQEYLALSEALQPTGRSGSSQNVMVILLRSGRFAAGLFLGPKCLVHRACQRYTVRKGQGKAQSTMDASRRPKSMGAQLRRAGEEQLQQDIVQTLQQWKSLISTTKCHLILLSCPKAMKKYLFDAVEEANVGVTKADSRLRRLPLDSGRPSYENVVMAYQVMMSVQIRHWSAVTNVVEAGEETNKPLSAIKPSTLEMTQQPSSIEPEITFPLTPLHKACQLGDVKKVTELLRDYQQVLLVEGVTESVQMTVQEMVNRRVGTDFMTCLHYAAESSTKREPSESEQPLDVDPELAAATITLLLLEGNADPTIVDSRHRPPYFLASHEKIRDAFRMARATLGEEYCRWDAQGKVGPPITEGDVQAKKEREAEKKRKKKARQKQKKAEEQTQVEQAERQRAAEEEARHEAEAAKRVRDGLQPKVAGGNVCDFCQTVVKGRKRKDMFNRLEYVYCTAECVQKHKRELMAAAALARFGGD
jgi:Bacteroidetes VLRF1 release factor/Vms1-associating treble clef domain